MNYRRQAAGSEQIAGAVEYARQIAESYLRALERADPKSRAIATGRLRGTRVLEVGPGSSCGTAVLLACLGARVTVADRYLVPWDEAFHAPFYRALLASVERNRTLCRRRFVMEPGPIRALLDANGFVDPVCRRVELSAETLSRLASRAFDLVVSNAVLEHVEHVPRALANIARVTTPGGLSLHQVDFRDHRDFDRPLEYLTLDGDIFWCVFRMRRGECGNRWRHSTMAGVFTSAGFDVLHFEANLRATPEYTRDIRRRLHPDFASLTDEDLSVLCGWFACRRTTASPDWRAFDAPGLVPAGERKTRSAVDPRRVVIYGAGTGGRVALELLARLGLRHRVVGICDSDPAKQGTRISRHRVTRFDEMPPSTYDLVIVASEPGRRAIGRELTARGLLPLREYQGMGFLDAFDNHTDTRARGGAPVEF